MNLVIVMDPKIAAAHSGVTVRRKVHCQRPKTGMKIGWADEIVSPWNRSRKGEGFCQCIIRVQKVTGVTNSAGASRAKSGFKTIWSVEPARSLFVDPGHDAGTPP
jgi:hypothetical protein